MFSNSEPKEEIKKIIEQFFKAMDNQNYRQMEKIIAHDIEGVHIGTDEGEIWTGWDELRPATVEQFENLEYYKAEIKDLQINILAAGQVAWYFHLLDARIKSRGIETAWKDARFTGVLEKRSADWKLAQTHVSLPS